MKCLSTRTRPDGVKLRRYERPGLPRITTVEVPVSVMRAVGGWKQLPERMEIFLRGDTARQRAAHVRATVAARPDWKSTALAHELGISEQRVRQIRRELTT